MLHTDIPTEPELRGLDAVREHICVSIYIPTTPVTREAKGDRILLKNLVTEACRSSGIPRPTSARLRRSRRS
jgi:hypothetical protein